MMPADLYHSNAHSVLPTSKVPPVLSPLVIVYAINTSYIMPHLGQVKGNVAAVPLAPSITSLLNSAAIALME